MSAEDTTEDTTQDFMVSTIVIGGCAAGAVIEVHNSAAKLELSSPDGHIKPVADIDEVETFVPDQKDVYNMHLLTLENDRGGVNIVGMAIVEDQDLTWAFQQLASAYNMQIMQLQGTRQ